MAQFTLTDTHRQAIADLLEARMAEGQYPSKARFARSIGITPSDYTNISTGAWKEKPRLVGTAKWMRVAREVGFSFSSAAKWNNAETAMYQLISKQLRICQRESGTLMFCDLAGFGKTWACKQYAAQHKEAFYVDCSTSPSKLAFIRSLATAIGIDARSGTSSELLAEVVYYIRAMATPLLIIDEAGDAAGSTYLLIKRLYNELQGTCGMYLIGARGLRRRIDRGIALRKNGFEELYSRFGCKYTDLVPVKSEDRLAFLASEAALIAQANGIQDKPRLNAILSNLTKDDDLRVVERQVRKHNRAA